MTSHIKISPLIPLSILVLSLCLFSTVIQAQTLTQFVDDQPDKELTVHQWFQQFENRWAEAATSLQKKHGYQYTVFLLQVINSWQYLTYYDKFPDHSLFMEASKITIIDMNQDSIMLSYCILEPSLTGYYDYRNLRTGQYQFMELDPAKIPKWIYQLQENGFIEEEPNPENLQFFKLIYSNKGKKKTIKANLFSVDITPFKLGCLP